MAYWQQVEQALWVGSIDGIQDKFLSMSNELIEWLAQWMLAAIFPHATAQKLQNAQTWSLPCTCSLTEIPE